MHRGWDASWDPFGDGGGHLVDPAGEPGEEQASGPCLAAQGDVQWYTDTPRRGNIHTKVETRQEPRQGRSTSPAPSDPQSSPSLSVKT